MPGTVPVPGGLCSASEATCSTLQELLVLSVHPSQGRALIVMIRPAFLLQAVSIAVPRQALISAHNAESVLMKSGGLRLPVLHRLSVRVLRSWLFGWRMRLGPAGSGPPPGYALREAGGQGARWSCRLSVRTYWRSQGRNSPAMSGREQASPAVARM